MKNEVQFVGNLTRDVKLRHTNGGKPVSSLDIALNYYVQNEKRTEFVEVTVWDKQAEDASKYLRKGRQVLVDARVVVKKRTLEGKNIPIPEFHAYNVLYLGSGSSNNSNGGSNQQSSNGNNGQQPLQGSQQPINDPFSSQNRGGLNQ